MVIFHPELDDEAMPQAIERVQSQLRGAQATVTVVNHDVPWGRRRLAYPIRHEGRDLRDGFYVLYYFNAESGQVAEFERDLKLNTQVIRYLLTQQTTPTMEPPPTQPPAEAAADGATEGADAATAAPAGAAAPAAESAPTGDATPSDDAPPAPPAGEAPVDTEDTAAAETPSITPDNAPSVLDVGGSESPASGVEPSPEAPVTEPDPS
jgi:small subunit ribosomal protein S6